MRLGSKPAGGGRGPIINVAKYLARLPIGAIVRNTCDSRDPDGEGVHIIKVASTRPGSERGAEWQLYDPQSGAAMPFDGEFAANSYDVFLPVQVVRPGPPG